MPDGTCPCVGSCLLPADCGRDSGCGTICGAGSPACEPCAIDPTQCGCPQEPGHGGSCGYVDDCGHVFGSSCDPGCDGYCCSPDCGSRPNDICQPDGTCTCVGTCSGYPDACNQTDGCGNSCYVPELCDPDPAQCWNDCWWSGGACSDCEWQCGYNGCPYGTCDDYGWDCWDPYSGEQCWQDCYWYGWGSCGDCESQCGYSGCYSGCDWWSGYCYEDYY
jgi:hypothetical protein